MCQLFGLFFKLYVPTNDWRRSLFDVIKKKKIFITLPNVIFSDSEKSFHELRDGA